MRIEEWLDILLKRYRVKVALVAADLPRQEREELLKDIKESIVLELGDQVIPERRLMAEAEGRLLAVLLGWGLSLPAKPLARGRHPRHVSGLNDEEAVCLWLGMFRQQTFGLAGLWQLYLDLEGPSLPLPQVIRQVFDPQGEDGENQDCISQILDKARQAGLELTDWDTSKIIAWVVQTCSHMRSRDPLEVAKELQKRGSKPVNAVDQNLLRGGNTLMDEFVRRVFQEIDNC